MAVYSRNFVWYVKRDCQRFARGNPLRSKWVLQQIDREIETATPFPTHAVADPISPVQSEGRLFRKFEPDAQTRAVPNAGRGADGAINTSYVGEKSQC